MSIEQPIRTLWIVSEQSPGHDSQSRGLGRELADRLKLDTVDVIGRMTARGWLRPWIKWRMGRAGKPLHQAMLDKHFKIEIPQNAPAPDLIVSSGGRSVYCARTWAQQYNTPYIYLGEQKRFPNEWFDLIITPIAGDPRPNALSCEIVPTPVSPSSIEAAASNLQRPSGRLWTMVIGGRSRSQHFEEHDWRTIGQAMNLLAERNGIRWLVTTSRRTGAEAEAVLKDAIDPQYIADAIWWAQAPRRQLHAFLHWGELSFITLDSVTMVSEAIAAANPVIAIPASDSRLAGNVFLSGFYGALADTRRMVVIPPGELADFVFDPDAIEVMDQPVMDRLAQQVIERLSLTKVAHQELEV
jgi:hypothetical protein